MLPDYLRLFYETGDPVYYLLAKEEEKGETPPQG